MRALYVSDFKSLFDHAADSLMSRLGESSDATLTRAADASTETVTVIFNEQVGFVDDRQRALFTVDSDDLTGNDLYRGDYFTLSGETQNWTVVDVRRDKAGMIEARCDATLTRL